MLADGSIVPIDPTINAGTAAVQHLYALLYDRADLGESRLHRKGCSPSTTPCSVTPSITPIEPLVPPDLLQPSMQLPFEPGATWSFTGGPHGGWGDGSAWAALDFAPAGEALGCVPK